MNHTLASAVALLALVAGCTGYAGQPSASSTPVNVAQVKNDDRSTGAAFFSDDEFERLRLSVVNLDDLAKFPRSAKLAPFVRVEVLDSKTLDLHGAGSTQTVPMRFDRVRVLDGAAAGHQGWISAFTLQ